MDLWTSICDSGLEARSAGGVNMLQKMLFQIIVLAVICHTSARGSCPHFEEGGGCPYARKFAGSGEKQYSKAQSRSFAHRC